MAYELEYPLTAKARKRLQEAVDWAKTFKLPKNATFDISTWGEHYDDHDPAEKNYCGTSACFCGWLSTDPKWRRRGLVGEWQKFGKPPWRMLNINWNIVQTAFDIWDWKYTGLDHWLFDLSDYPNDGENTKMRDVVKRIQAILKQDEKLRKGK